MAAKPKRNVQKELDELRAQVAALEAGQPATTREPDETPAAPPEHNDLGSRFEELFHSLEQDLNDTPTTTCLAIFALGILVGRTLAA